MAHFHADYFLEKFRNQIGLLRAFADRWKGKTELKPDFSLEDFQKFLRSGNDGVDGELLEELHRIHDLSKFGSEPLLQLCRDKKYDPDPKNELPVECLAVKVFVERETLFNTAYDLRAISSVEKFYIFQGKKPMPVENIDQKSLILKSQLSSIFIREKGSDRVIVRPYDSNGVASLIIYHEKRVQSKLLFKDKSNVKPSLMRPAQQDFIRYQHASGKLEIKTFREVDVLRQAFGATILGDAQFFESNESSEIFDLQRILQSGFRMDTDQNDRVLLKEIHCSLDQDFCPKFVIRSQNVLSTIDINDFRDVLKDALIKEAHFQFLFAGKKRGTTVKITDTNKIELKQAYADRVYRYLTRWGIQREIKLAATPTEAKPNPVADFSEAGTGKMS